MIPYVDEPDFVLYLGDALDVLRELPAESVDCVVTSPPYWGLRDYGTATWVGGDDACEHTGVARRMDRADKQASSKGTSSDRPSSTCLRCGATRVDAQLGLEATPTEYVANMVAIFAETRRVLTSTGTCWLNLGDSYSQGGYAGDDAPSNARRIASGGGTENGIAFRASTFARQAGDKPNRRSASAIGLKPKDLVGIPWRVAFALQADGWYLRSDVIWSKPNPMPESVTDRPTREHEYVFLLTKSPRYYFDAHAIRERATTVGLGITRGINGPHAQGGDRDRESSRLAVGDEASRNVRSVWTIATQPYTEAHFATFPTELPRRCIVAGCPEWVCSTCGTPRERIVDRIPAAVLSPRSAYGHGAGRNGGRSQLVGAGAESIGWTDCGHGTYRPGVVLDPFMGSGTTAKVARDNARRAIGIELNPEYAALAAKRNSQLTIYSYLEGGS